MAGETALKLFMKKRKGNPSIADLFHRVDLNQRSYEAKLQQVQTGYKVIVDSLEKIEKRLENIEQRNS